jgi:hypothetical protein
MLLPARTNTSAVMAAGRTSARAAMVPAHSSAERIDVPFDANRLGVSRSALAVTKVGERDPQVRIPVGVGHDADHGFGIEFPDTPRRSFDGCDVVGLGVLGLVPWCEGHRDLDIVGDVNQATVTQGCFEVDRADGIGTVVTGAERRAATQIGDADTHLFGIFTNRHGIVAVTGVHFEVERDAITGRLGTIDIRLR